MQCMMQLYDASKHLYSFVFSPLETFKRFNNLSTGLFLNFPTSVVYSGIICSPLLCWCLKRRGVVHRAGIKAHFTVFQVHEAVST